MNTEKYFPPAGDYVRTISFTTRAVFAESGRPLSSGLKRAPAAILAGARSSHALLVSSATNGDPK